MDYNKIIQDLKKKIYHPVYILHGNEPFFIDKISDYIEDNVLDDSEKAFDQVVVYGKDIDVRTLMSSLKQYPSLGSHRVVIVKEAQDIRQIELLEEYLDKPMPSTILVISYKHKKLDKRKRFYKLASKNGVAFESKPIYDNQVPDWIKSYLKTQGYDITEKSALLLGEYLGNNLSKITNEINKMLINVSDKKTIDENDIESNIGISKDYNIFELQDALGSRNMVKVNRIVNYFNANQKDHPAVMVVAMLYTYFQKLFLYHFLTDKSKQGVASKIGVPVGFVYKYKQAAANYPTKKLSKIMHDLRVYDLKAKGLDNASTSSGELLRELIFKITH